MSGFRTVQILKIFRSSEPDVMSGRALTTIQVFPQLLSLKKNISFKVRDAAESLLCSLMEQVDFFTVQCGAESLQSTIDEVSYVYLSSGEMLTMLQAAQNFRYYVLDNNILLGIFEDVSRTGYENEQQAKVAIILRGMSSRSAWTMQLR